MTLEKLGHYSLIDKLGEGGMGVAYRAFDEQLQRDVAIKVLPASSFRDETARARLLREARSAAALNHPNICTVYEVGESDGQAYIAMELIEGQTLSSRLVSGRLPVNDIARFGVQIADALAHAHERGVVHRDLKSANIMITAEGRAKVLDFGLAKRLPAADPATARTQAETVTQPGMVAGTLAYMAPEQLVGEGADARSDIWALGVVLHEMASGVRPFKGTTGFELSSAILKGSPAPLPESVRPELRSILERCLEKEPQRRYQRAIELRTALEVVQSGNVPLTTHEPRWSRRQVLGACLVVLAALAAVLTWLMAGGGRNQPVESVAVLPWENLSRTPEQDELIEGIQQAIITDLAKFGGFRKVIGSTSVQRYRKSDKPIPVIASELGVQAVLTGSVLRSGDRVSISARLIKADTEESLWAERYERQLRDVFALQNEIVTAMAREIHARLNGTQKSQMATRRPVNPESQDAYVRGVFHINKYTPEGFSKGLNYLHQAVEKDPGNALAYGGLALAYSVIGHTPAAPPDALPKAKAAAMKALELDPNLPEAHEALAEHKLYSDRDYNWVEAEKLFRRVLELNPSLPQAHGHLGWLLLIYGRRDEGVAEMRRAVELDPLNSLYAGWLASVQTGGWYSPTVEAEFGPGIELFKKCLELEPNSGDTWWALGQAYGTKRMYEESIRAHEKAISADPTWKWGLGVTYAQMGRKDEARKIAAELGRDKGVWNTFGIAEIYATLGDREEALRWLEAAFQQRHTWIPWIGRHANFASLRGDPRFEDLLKRMKIPGHV